MAAPLPEPVVPSRAAAPSWAMRGLFWIALVWLVKVAQPFLAPVAVALVLALLLGPGVRALKRRGVPLAAGASLMICLVLLVVALIAGTVASPAALWWERAPVIVTQLLVQVERVRTSLGLGASVQVRKLQGPGPLTASAGTPAATVPGQTADPMRERIASEGVVLTGSLLGDAARLVAQGAGTLLLLFFLLISEHWIVSRVVGAFPERRRRAVVLSGLRTAQRDISRFFGSLGLVYAGLGAAVALGLLALGLPNPMLWGVLTALLSFIPYIGPALMTALLAAAGLASFGVDPAAALPPLTFLMLHMVEANFVSPWFVAQRLSLSPIAVFLSVLFWAWVWGITGALLAVPLLVGLRSLCRRHRSLRLLHLLIQGSHTAAPSLRSLLRIQPPVPATRRRHLPR